MSLGIVLDFRQARGIYREQGAKKLGTIRPNQWKETKKWTGCPQAWNERTDPREGSKKTLNP